MPLMSTCLGRLGSRYSIILDPFRKKFHYGTAGLMTQKAAQLIVTCTDESGHVARLPLSAGKGKFDIVDQTTTPTSVTYYGYSVRLGIALEMTITAPFWPHDEKTSLVPAYIVELEVKKLGRFRWEKPHPEATGRGTLRFGIKLPGADVLDVDGALEMRYEVKVPRRESSAEGGQTWLLSDKARKTRTTGSSTDRILPLKGPWQVDAAGGVLQVDYDIARKTDQVFRLAMVGFMPDAMFERFGQAMPLKYTHLFKNIDAACNYVKRNANMLLEKAGAFDTIFTESSLPKSVVDLTGLSFQSYLMNTMWCAGTEKDQPDWFSVWEGSCWYNSTVDVTYNEAMFYFTLWPELLEMIFAQWSCHANNAEQDAARRAIVTDDEKFVASEEEFNFPGRIMEHDMGCGWTANGQSYHHAMPVEENSDFLLLLYAHGKWWGREELFETYSQLVADLVEYLLWTDSTGTGFPDRGTANTIDDATPAVQYGRDNLYLGIKRLAAIHAAAGMLEKTGRDELAATCRATVAHSVAELDKGWLGDHWGVCLDKSAEGLIDSWTRKPLEYKILPGWDAYSLYTTNGLLYLMMIDDLPEGIDSEKLRVDVVNATRESMTEYGCGHSSLDTENMWVSMNVWRDCAAGYLGENMLDNAQRYWNMQVFGNGPGAMKPNCFIETSLTNNLVWYPRNAAIFGLTLAAARLVMTEDSDDIVLDPIETGYWPLLPLADWDKGEVPFAVASIENDQLTMELQMLELLPEGKKQVGKQR
ncbi:MAG: glutaminase domain-containing protein [Phycisphaerae bacterium]